MIDISLLTLKNLLPELFLAFSTMVLMVVGAFRGQNSTSLISVLSVFCLAVAGYFLASGDWATVTLFNNMLLIDPFGAFIKLVIVVGLAVVIVLSNGWMRDEKMAVFEYPILVLFAGIGMLLMVSAHDFLTLYVSLELQSLALYVLAAIRRDTVVSAEAGIKYFVLGALSSGLLLFGISLIYGYAGSTQFDLVAQNLIQQLPQPSLGAIVGMVFVLVGLSFKISAVPFHMWTPDVYQGAATPVTAFFAMVPKIAAMGLIIRVLDGPFGPVEAQWQQIIIFLSVASMLWGAFAALGQENIKRLMAYSSIANMGYALVGLLAFSADGIASVLIYMLVYMVMGAGTFAVIMNLRRGEKGLENISDLAGLSKTAPAQAYCLAALMFSMSGIPPLAGFFSKLFVFQAAVAAGHYVVAVIGLVTSVVAAYYYLRIIKVMFFDQPDANPFEKQCYTGRCVALTASIAFITLFVLSPNLLLDYAKLASSALFQ